MAAVGPVCHIPPKTVAVVKNPVPIPAVPPPAKATLASLQYTVNQLREIINIITGQQGNNGSSGSISSPAGGSFTQTSVQYKSVRVYQNNDVNSPNFVDVQYVSKLVMGNNSTKSTWTYNAEDPNSSG